MELLKKLAPKPLEHDVTSSLILHNRKEEHVDHHYYHTSEFAQKASVSVRTLRYYDKVGLLSPSAYTEGGYRLYTDTDLLRLQQILALKFLGFSLGEIGQFLNAEPLQLKESLAQQKAMMKERRTQLNTVIGAITETEELLQANKLTWESIVRVIQVIQMTQNNEWQEKYFTPAQRQTMSELSKKSYTEEAAQKLKAYHPNEWTEEDQKRVDEQYHFVKQELGRLVALGADPASPEAQHMAQIRHELAFSFSHDDPDIEESLGKWWQAFSELPQEQKPFDMSVYTYTKEEQDFLDKALDIYKQSHTVGE